MIQVIGIAGSIRRGSYTRMALDAALDGARMAGADTHVLAMDQPALPLFERDQAPTEVVSAFKRAVQTADALLLATPVYHDSFSGILKNALDHLTEELRQKPVALISAGGGRAGGGQALGHLRTVLRELDAFALNRHVLVSPASSAFDERGKPRSPELGTRLRQLGQELVAFTRDRARLAALPPDVLDR